MSLASINDLGYAEIVLPTDSPCDPVTSYVAFCTGGAHPGKNELFFLREFAVTQPECVNKCGGHALKSSTRVWCRACCAAQGGGVECPDKWGMWCAVPTLADVVALAPWEWPLYTDAASVAYSAGGRRAAPCGLVSAPE